MSVKLLAKSILTASLLAVAAAANASALATVQCPTGELVRTAAPRMNSAVKLQDHYLVTDESISFYFDNHVWLVGVRAKDVSSAKEAIEKAKKMVSSADAPVSSTASVHNRGAYFRMYECDYDAASDVGAVTVEFGKEAALRSGFIELKK